MTPQAIGMAIALLGVSVFILLADLWAIPKIERKLRRRKFKVVK